MIKNKISKIKNTKLGSKGFTLIELIIFMGVFSVLMLALFQLFTAIFDVQLESTSTSVIAQDGRYILNKLTYDIENATSVVAPNAGSQSATLKITDGMTTYTYSLDSGNLVLNNSALGTTDQLNSVNSTITSLNFLRLSDTKGQNTNTITITFTLNSKTVKRSGAVSDTFNFTVGTR